MRFGSNKCPRCKEYAENCSQAMCSCSTESRKRTHSEDEEDDDTYESSAHCSHQRVSVDDSDDLGFEMAEFDAAVMRQRIGRDYDVLVETVDSDDEDEDEEDATNVDIDDNYERNSGARCWMYRCDGDEEMHNREVAYDGSMAMDDDGDEGGSNRGIDDEHGEDNGVENGTEAHEILNDGNMAGGGNEFVCCKNCHREESNEATLISSEYAMTLQTYQSSEVHTRKKFSTLRVADLAGSSSVSLCNECASFLVHDRNRGMEDMWPAFLWKLLTNEKLITSHGSKLWGCIPQAWRFWWRNALRRSGYYGGVYNDITMDLPVSVFKDVTNDRNEFSSILKRLRMKELKSGCDKHLKSLVRCPWGCTEFLHKADSIPLDVVLRRYLGVNLVVTCKADDHLIVRGAREDYMVAGDEALLLCNPEWKIRPSLAFVNQCGPCVLVCRNHKGGCKLDYVHVPRHPKGILPDTSSDQIAHAVVTPRTIRPMRASQFSNSYQMHEMRGSYAGIDTMSVTDVGRFDVSSVIRENNENIMISGRKDIRGLVARKAQNGLIPPWLGDSLLHRADAAEEVRRREFEEDVSRGMEDNMREWWDAYCLGCTRVTFPDSVKLQKLLDDSAGWGIVVQIGDSEHAQYETIVPSWPREIVWSHPNSPYGARIPAVKAYRQTGKDTRYLWFLVAVLISVPNMWKHAAGSVQTTAEWPGWVMSHVSKKYFPYKRVSRKNPFTKGGTEEKLLESIVGNASDHMYNPDVFWDTLSAIHNIRKFRATDLADDNMDIQDQDDTVVILRSEEDGTISLPERIANEQYELRFVATSDTGEPARGLHSWTGTFYVRHGGRMFPKWWKQSRNETMTSQCESLSNSVNVCWNMAVYVKRSEATTFETLRDDYLGYIGGQSKVYCQAHNYPMIVAARTNEGSKKCCSWRDQELSCQRKPVLTCPVRGCHCCVCKAHCKSESDSSKLYISPPPEGLMGEEEDEHDDLEHDEEDEDDNNETLDSCEEHDCEWNENAESRGTLDGDFMVDAMLVDDEENESDDEAASVGFISTNAGAQCVPIWNVNDSHVAWERRYVSSHVILNNCGSCLIRRNQQLRATQYQRAFLERIVSTSKGESVPLVYPEAMLYPSIFWKDDDEGAMFGAMPSALLAADRECASLGFAGVGDHMRTRLTDMSSRTSTDPRYIFYAFDCLANVHLRGQDSRIVLSRGFVKEEGSVGMRSNCSEHFNTDAIDSRPVVNRLAAAVKDEPATYFFTQTCNQREFFGVREIKRWLDSDELRNLLKEEASDSMDVDDLLKAVKQSACVVLNRNWMEVAEIYMLYIAKSPEHPLGEVAKIWWRHEYQDATGNLSHIHCLIWLRDTSHQWEIQDRIRGSISELIRPSEIEQLVQEGFLHDGNDVYRVREDGRRFLFHTHSERCLRRTGDGPNDFQCRMPNGIIESPDPRVHCMKELGTKHSNAALQILDQLGFCDLDESGRPVHLDEQFRSYRHYPPVDSGMGIISPTNPRLFMATRSTCNLQLCTRYFSSRYLAKYVAGVDESNVVYISAASAKKALSAWDSTNSSTSLHTHMDAGLVMDSVFLHNTKITSSAINEQKAHNSRRNRHHPKGRAISITEACSLILGYPQVYTDLEFIDIPTVSLEDRAGVERTAPVFFMDDRILEHVSGPRDLLPGQVIASYAARQRLRGLQRWRQLSDSEINILKDQAFSPVSVDRTTIFGVRPPELRFVQSQSLYFRWFHREKAVSKYVDACELHASLLDVDVKRSAWVDGLNCRVRLRRAAIPEVAEYVRSNRRRLNIDRNLELLFVRLARYQLDPPLLGQRREQWNEWQESLLCRQWQERAHLPLVVYSNIKPTQMHRFVLHVLLSMGEFNNELELFSVGDLRESFKVAGLVNFQHLDRSIHALLRRYVLEQLIYIPGGTQMFDRLLIAANSVLQSLLSTGELPSDELPAVLYTRLQQQSSDSHREHVAKARRTLSDATVARIRTDAAHANVPDGEAFAAATQLHPLPRNTPVLLQASRQTVQSYHEQRQAIGVAMESIEQYVQISQRFQVKSVCIVGPPGCGKTFIMSILILRALGYGLNAAMIALMSERALLLGGIHLHKLFELPVHDTASVHRLAELALLRLYKNTQALYVLQTLDVLFIDELGQLSAQLISCLDIILRRVRNSNLFMGGVIIIATQDPEQLRPVSGLPSLLSPCMMTCFRFIQLTKSVRASGDPALQRIQDISRMLVSEYEENPSLISEFRQLLSDNCTFVDTWDDPIITSSMLRVFGKHAAVRIAERKLLAQLEASNQQVQRSVARDYQLSLQSHSTWATASARTTTFLNRNVKEMEVVHFYQNAVYELTYNEKGLFSQSQVAVLARMPTMDDLRNHRDIELYLAPEGCKTVPNDLDDTSALLALGWVLIHVGLAPERIHTIHSLGLKAKRQQYGIRHRIASTIHATMGNDLMKLVTCVSKQNKDYQLWEKAQGVVLLSRTCHSEDMIFVGRKADTIDALVELIQIRSQYSEYMSTLLHNLCLSGGFRQHDFPRINLTLHPFRPIDVPLPEDNSGFVYVLLSLNNLASTYIGQTRFLVRRLKQHNSSHGSQQTADSSLRPWALLAFVCGFDGNRSQMLQFERRWQQRRDYLVGLQGHVHPSQIANLAQTLLSETVANGGPGELRFVQCGSLHIA